MIRLSGAAEICALLREKPEAVLVLPTETVYGIVGRADVASVPGKIRALKGREAAKPFQFLLKNQAQAEALGGLFTCESAALLQRFMPGPLMLIVPRKDGATLGFRIPEHPLIAAVLDALDIPLIASSANRSGEPNCTSIQAALEALYAPVEGFADGGTIENPRASTIVDCTVSPFRILREGPISESAIRETLQQARKKVENNLNRG